MILSVENDKKYKLLALKIEAVKNSTFIVNNLISKNPIQDGDTISDHIVKLPSTISFTGKLSDIFIEYRRDNDKIEGNLQDKIRALLDLNDRRVGFNAQIDYFTLENVVIENIKFSNSINSSLPFTITLSQFIVQKTKNRVVSVKGLNPKVDKGTQQFNVLKTSIQRPDVNKIDTISNKLLHTPFFKDTIKNSKGKTISVNGYKYFDIASVPTSKDEFYCQTMAFEGKDYIWEFRTVLKQVLLKIKQNKKVIIQGKIFNTVGSSFVWDNGFFKIYSINGVLYFASIPKQYRLDDVTFEQYLENRNTKYIYVGLGLGPSLSRFQGIIK